MEVLNHKIAGIAFRTESNAWLPWLREDPFDRFLTGQMTPDVRHRVCKVNIDSMRLTPFSPKERKLLRQCDGYCPEWLKKSLLKCEQVRTRLKALAAGAAEMEIWVDEHYVFLFDFSCNQIDLFYTESFGGFVAERQRYMPEHHVASNFQQIFSTFLPHFGAILLHASGVIRRQKAALFLAPDEGGKTTVVEAANGEPVLNDDLLIVRKEGDHIAAHGTPLGVITSGPCQARVGALFMLERGTSFQLEPIPPSELVQCIWTAHRHNFFFLPNRLKQHAFRTLSDLCYQSPAYLMRFSKDFVDWDAIDEAME